MNDKKERYWKYFTEPGRLNYGFGITQKRLKKIKDHVMQDVDFWGDMRRHGFPDDPVDLCEHGVSNWVGMIHQIMIERKVITRRK